MSRSSKNQFKLHKTASLAIFAVYLIVSTSIELFHSEGCVFGVLHHGTTNGMSSNKPCPACMFLAGYNSTESNHSLTLVSTESPLISQFLPQLTVVNHDEWACSVMLRAPPSITIS